MLIDTKAWIHEGNLGSWNRSCKLWLHSQLQRAEVLELCWKRFSPKANANRDTHWSWTLLWNGDSLAYKIKAGKARATCYILNTCPSARETKKWHDWVGGSLRPTCQTYQQWGLQIITPCFASSKGSAKTNTMRLVWNSKLNPVVCRHMLSCFLTNAATLVVYAIVSHLWR